MSLTLGWGRDVFLPFVPKGLRSYVSKAHLALNTYADRFVFVFRYPSLRFLPPHEIQNTKDVNGVSLAVLKALKNSEKVSHRSDNPQTSTCFNFY